MQMSSGVNRGILARRPSPPPTLARASAEGLLIISSPVDPKSVGGLQSDRQQTLGRQVISRPTLGLIAIISSADRPRPSPEHPQIIARRLPDHCPIVNCNYSAERRCELFKCDCSHDFSKKWPSSAKARRKKYPPCSYGARPNCDYAITGAI